MRKYRIKEVKTPKGKTKFIIQEKWLFWWLSFPDSYKKLSKAEKFIKNELIPKPKLENVIPIEKLGSK